MSKITSSKAKVQNKNKNIFIDFLNFVLSTYNNRNTHKFYPATVKLNLVNEGALLLPLKLIGEVTLYCQSAIDN